MARIRGLLIGGVVGAAAVYFGAPWQERGRRDGREFAGYPSSMTADALRPPTGAQHLISHGAQRAIVVQVGGGLREYEVDGFPVLDGYPADEMARAGRGHVLVPWPNRVAGGSYEFGDQTLQGALSERRLGDAVAGLVRRGSGGPLGNA